LTFDEYIQSIPVRKFSLRFGYVEPTDEILSKMKGVPTASIYGSISINRQRLFLYSIFLNKVIQKYGLRCYEIDNFSNYFPYVSMFRITRYLECMLCYLIKKKFYRQYKKMKNVSSISRPKLHLQKARSELLALNPKLTNQKMKF